MIVFSFTNHVVIDTSGWLRYTRKDKWLLLMIYEQRPLVATVPAGQFEAVTPRW